MFLLRVDPIECGISRTVTFCSVRILTCNVTTNRRLKGPNGSLARRSCCYKANSMNYRYPVCHS